MLHYSQRGLYLPLRHPLLLGFYLLGDHWLGFESATGSFSLNFCLLLRAGDDHDRRLRAAPLAHMQLLLQQPFSILQCLLLPGLCFQVALQLSASQLSRRAFGFFYSSQGHKKHPPHGPQQDSHREPHAQERPPLYPTLQGCSWLHTGLNRILPTTPDVMLVVVAMEVHS